MLDRSLLTGNTLTGKVEREVVDRILNLGEGVFWRLLTALAIIKRRIFL